MRTFILFIHEFYIFIISIIIVLALIMGLDGITRFIRSLSKKSGGKMDGQRKQ